MGKRRMSNQSSTPAGSVSEPELRKTQAEIADQSGELPELDLHGQTAQEAGVNVYGYVTSMADSGSEPCCLIIHGKGTGVLQQAVTDELDDLAAKNIIETYFQSRKYPGAAIVVVFFN
jgi:DNA-nicking Smr family endonuclease